MSERSLIQYVKRLIQLVWVLIICVVGSTALFLSDAMGLLSFQTKESELKALASNHSASEKKARWQAPDTSAIPNDSRGDLIRYGRELIAHTSVYLGPKGKVRKISNGLNCQNCHLKAGTVPFGNNYARVASSYPKRRNRSGTVEGFVERVNGCFERSLNGQPLEPDSREMQAMVAYLKWVGKDVEKGETLLGLGLVKLTFLDRPADPIKGKSVYDSYCARCHGEEGEGQLAESGLEWIYPPLYGDDSYNYGAGLYRLSKFASYVKANMPYGVTFENPFLTDEEAWDVAAYVNSMPRPEKDLIADWPNITKKPVDHPFGPYADNFTEEQHKYGPFPPIIAARE
ncbi:MAG: c-type cytochrome [Tunicatimonas sp.]|uniref:c-type cytochrome n=1 Tax=Tunicatimonas sp. TaxID=1940096 RepID=UPI003C7096C9